MINTKPQKPLAVYGTLKQGCSNHEYFLGDAQLLGKSTISGFDMYSLGGFPGIVPGEGAITVELYDNYRLGPIDSLEGEGSLYKRTVVTTDQGVECYVYVLLRTEYLQEDRKMWSGCW